MGSIKLSGHGEFVPVRVAAIEVGSNAIRFIAAQFDQPDRYQVLEQVRSPVRLGHDVFLTGALAANAMSAALAALRKYRTLLESLEVHRYRAIATSAVRDSANRAEFLGAVLGLGIALEPISGEEEARLAQRAVSHRIPLGDHVWVHADVGGGSVEVSLIDQHGLRATDSHKLGAIRLLEQLGGADDPLRFRRRVEECTATLRLPDEARAGLAGFIATGGNIEVLARLTAAPTDASGVALLHVGNLHALIETLAQLSFAERVARLGLREDRADVILPAALVYQHLAGLASANTIRVPFVGVKDGVLLDLAGPARN